jgi:prepilin-type N-terminal cleavage/methylation domain-containing protein
MAKNKAKLPAKFGFTMIEMLVVIAIMVLLVSILVPGIRGIARVAKNLKQKTHFHSIEIALELFRDEHGDYPDSAVLTNAAATGQICGAQHLVEAVLGRDLKGFDPQSTWCASAEESSSEKEIYASLDKGSDPATEIEASKHRRKGPFMELKGEIGVYTMGEIYSGNTGSVYPSQNGYFAPVITDVFGKKKKITLNNGNIVKCGLPVLYYKANTSSESWPSLNSHPLPGYGNVPVYANIPGYGNDNEGGYIYDFFDNFPIIYLEAEKENFDFDGYKTNFYEMLTNYNLINPAPHNPKTYILISAGWDGIYGTKDDVTNFD